MTNIQQRALQLLFVCGVLVLAGCGSSTDAAITAADATDTPAVDATTIAATEAPTTEAPTTEAPTTEAPTTTAPATTSTASTTTEAVPAAVDGMALYEANCARCHGSDGTGGRGPSLVEHLATHGDRDVEFALITTGEGEMPAFGDRFTEDDINAVIDYYTDTFGPSS